MGDSIPEIACQTAVIFGAGSVGRGFLGQLFSESGYEVVFVDVDEVLVKALATQGSYTLRLAGLDRQGLCGRSKDLIISSVRAVDARDTEQVAAEVAQASLMATAAGARALPAIGKTMAAGLVRRWEASASAPLNVIVCENLRDAPERLHSYVEADLPQALQPAWRERVSFVPAVIARMAPAPTPEQRATDPTLIITEPYKVLPVDREAFLGPIPDIVGLQPVSPFIAYVDRKLYSHNGAHAILGYLGYLRGHVYGYEALEDPELRSRLDQAVDEANRALAARYDFDPAELSELSRDLLARFGNRALADPITRICRDPLRKLAPDDRLVGAARLAEKHGIEPEGIAWGIAAALAYADPSDAHAAELQQRLAAHGLNRVLHDVCHIEGEEPLAGMIRERFMALREDIAWRRT